MRALDVASSLALCGLLICISMVSLTERSKVRSIELYNKWGTNDKSDHWGGVGSENYEEGKAATKWDNSGWNENYHPRDSSSGDGDSMEPAWWRSGPGANSEYTGHAMDGELYSPPDVKIFKPFFMRQKTGTRMPKLAELPSGVVLEAEDELKTYPHVPAGAAYICKGGDCRYYLDSSR